MIWGIWNVKKWQLPMFLLNCPICIVERVYKLVYDVNMHFFTDFPNCEFTMIHIGFLEWYSGVQHILCCVFVLFFFVLCTLFCQFFLMSILIALRYSQCLFFLYILLIQWNILPYAYKTNIFCHFEKKIEIQNMIQG